MLALAKGRAAVAIGLLAATTIVAGGSAHAQDPVPAWSFTDTYPGNIHYATEGVVIEGLGVPGCGHSLSTVEADTVASIKAGHPTITEISPQSACASLHDYADAFTSLATYVDNNAAAAGTLWGGIMLDEEPTWFATWTDFTWLNQQLGAAMQFTDGISWWYNEIGPSNNGVDWSQTQYDYLVWGCTYQGESCYYSFDAPQIYNNRFAALANGAGDDDILVTWCDAGCAAYPFDVAPGTNATNAINGAPYHETFGTTHDYEWKNHFV